LTLISPLRNIFEQAADGIAHNSPDGKFLRVNDRFCSILGYRHDELQELTVPDITHSNDLEVERLEIQRLLEGEKKSTKWKNASFVKTALKFGVKSPCPW
jgi:PAS domain S-box-containing protein